MADYHRYRKNIKDVEIAVLRKKDPFPKTVIYACRLLNRWQNDYGGHSIPTELNNERRG